MASQARFEAPVDQAKLQEFQQLGTSEKKTCEKSTTQT
jgi:hypothetical protein